MAAGPRAQRHHLRGNDLDLGGSCSGGDRVFLALGMVDPALAQFTNLQTIVNPVSDDTTDPLAFEKKNQIGVPDELVTEIERERDE
ncbi:unnamed protein product [Urochloa humidicola]